MQTRIKSSFCIKKKISSLFPVVLAYRTHIGSSTKIQWSWLRPAGILTCAFQNMVAHQKGLPIVLQRAWQSDFYVPWISRTVTLMTVKLWANTTKCPLGGRGWIPAECQWSSLGYPERFKTHQLILGLPRQRSDDFNRLTGLLLK